MKNYFNYIKLLALALIVGIMSSCTKKADELERIPKEARIVLAMDAGSLHDKGNFEEVTDLKMYKFLEKEMKSESSDMADMFEDAINDYKVTGLNARGEMFWFMVNENSDEEYFGFVFDMLDQDDFEKYIKDFFKEIGEEVTIEEKENYRYWSPDDDAWFGWNGTSLVLLGTEDYSSRKQLGDHLDDIFEMGKDKSILEVKDFNNFYNARKDVSFWMSYALLSDMGMDDVPGMGNMGGMGNMMDLDFDDLYLHAYLNFEKDMIVMEGKMSPKEVVDEQFDEYKFFRNGVDDKVLSYLPEKAYMAAGFAMVPTEYYKWIKSIFPIAAMESGVKEEMGFGITEAVEAIGGDFVFSISGFDMKEVEYTEWNQEWNPEKFSNYNYKTGKYEYTGGYDYVEVQGTKEVLLPDMAMVASINNSEIFDKFAELLEKSMGEDDYEKFGDIYKIEADNMNIFFSWNDEVMMIATDLELIEDALDKELDKTLAGTDIGKSLTSNASYFYFDLNMEDYPGEVENYIKEEMGGDEFYVFSNIMETFNMMSMASDVNNYSFTMKVKTKDTGENSLYTLIKLIDDNLPFDDM